MMNNVVITISGQSGSGKSTLEDMLVEKYPNKFGKIISHTTRPKRFNEVDGQDYFFVNQSEFDKLEMMETVSFNGNSYGASKKEFDKVFKENKTPVIVVTPEGTEQIDKKCIEYNWVLYSIFIDSTDSLLMKRLFRRGISDMVLSEDKEKTLNSYLVRIENMFHEETTWKMYFDWYQTFDKFDEDVEDEIINEIYKNSDVLKLAKSSPLDYRETYRISAMNTNCFNDTVKCEVMFINWLNQRFKMIITFDATLYYVSDIKIVNDKNVECDLSKDEKFDIIRKIINCSKTINNFNCFNELKNVLGKILSQENNHVVQID